MCRGLEYLRGKNIIHRDLKCANVLITKDGVLKIADFGLSKVLAGSKKMANTYCGTPLYSSPEVLNFESYTFTSDIWSLGIILYHVCMLELPFPSMKEIFKGKYNPVTGYSEGLKNLIHSCLEENPQKRPSL